MDNLDGRYSISESERRQEEYGRVRKEMQVLAEDGIVGAPVYRSSPGGELIHVSQTDRSNVVIIESRRTTWLSKCLPETE